jgi:hypothetical protein
MDDFDYVLAPALLLVVAFFVLGFVFFQLRRLRSLRMQRCCRIGAYSALNDAPSADRKISAQMNVRTSTPRLSEPV